MVRSVLGNRLFLAVVLLGVIMLALYCLINGAFRHHEIENMLGFSLLGFVAFFTSMAAIDDRTKRVRRLPALLTFVLVAAQMMISVAQGYRWSAWGTGYIAFAWLLIIVFWNRAK